MQEAIEQYTTALRLKPNFAEAYNNLGAALASQGRVAEASSHYSEAIRLQPHHVKARYSLGVLLATQGRFAEAKQHFSEVLRLDPNHAAARPFLAGDVPPGNSTMGASHPDTRPCMSLPRCLFCKCTTSSLGTF